MVQAASAMNAFVGQLEEATVLRREGSDTKAATDALLRSLVESERVGATFPDSRAHLAELA